MKREIPEDEKGCWNCDHYTFVQRDQPGHAYCLKYKKHFSYHGNLKKKCKEWK